MSRGGKKKGERTLTQELASFLSKVLVPDLTERAKTREVRHALEKRYLHEKAANRVAVRLEEWIERTVEQVGAAWVLSCVFIRTLEDRELLGQRRLAGPGAKDSYNQFIEIAPSLNARDYLLVVLREVASFSAAEDVLGPRHNPAWRLSPSHEAARKLLDVFQEEDENGTLRWTFSGAATRFLGDLYQDLSEEVRKRYALLQTPPFVEKFILDLTLEPAIVEFGLEEVRLIDPTCGSGHFLLGAFERLFEQRRLKAPGVSTKEHALAALAQVYGVDLNPYAVAIARFRLALAYLEKAEIGKLINAPRLPLNLVVADSLLYGGRHQANLSELDEDRARWGDEIFDLEHPTEARRVFGQRYHAVVGNPPYITCKDAALRDAYRARYDSCYREYALAAPFTERFFELSVDSGFVGLINANSFMKREFGRRLIEVVLPRYDLSRVIDTSGAYIPGHGTPTVLLFGRNRRPMADTIPVVLGKRGEPSTPDDAAQGKVWSSISLNYAVNQFEDEFISVAMFERGVLSRYPWSLGGGGLSDLKECLDERAVRRLKDVVESIGFGAISGEDEVFLLPRDVALRNGIRPEHLRPMIVGGDVRDWGAFDELEIVWPCNARAERLEESDIQDILRFFWPWRRRLQERKVFGVNILKRGIPWWAIREVYKDRFQTPLTITFPFVATHNHFVLDRGGRVFNRTAPIIKLPERVGEDEHLELLGYLNSSTACFWMKQVFQPKNSAEHKTHPDPERNRYEHAGEGLKALPVPRTEQLGRKLVELSRRLMNLASERGALLSKSSFFQAIESSASGKDLVDKIASLWRAADHIREQMIVLQEELDWSIYVLFGLAPADVLLDTVLPGSVCPRGMRPFERILPRKSFVRERGVGISLEQAEIPPVNALSEWLEKTWERRAGAIQSVPELSILEQPLFKRQWRDTDENISEFRYREDKALSCCEQWVTTRLEEHFSREVGGPCAAIDFDELSGRLRGKLGFGALLEFVLGLSGMPKDMVGRIVALESVPFLLAMRMTESGLARQKDWEATWVQQRAEDSGQRIRITIPPEYESDDFVSPQVWRHRGALDVPKERFILYPGLAKDGQGALVGWTGWNMLERANVLAALYQERKMGDGWESERLVPLLAGLLELVPWLQQWHNEPNPDFNGERLGDYYAQFVTEEARSFGLTLDDLRNWRPAKAAAKKRTPKKNKAAASDTEDAA